ncbi:methionine ABC transporter substrate-binding protein [Halobacillus halophilus]|uniref:Lipoprotein n=1 Tax=Halobacillus halophilus (strain ATCC 35676 / DSM 2266 / JCM 20832 / KCTC 3685 / LMG 17431 / NBRC 102448 / NCIMB 2269) TaxID=866895 RepID=I0JT05_HALH3|nr:MetQ/NlpA family ABC transporter substrate-binding protein [Halobacillus halophilus]ASF41198.1 methionine ABC transporter substrate-binding protein [Halobacillus halophilus]CCG47277.1 ABC-type transport system extracellular binding protein (probable substrate methionine) [Halobacillus halophilus DSM 2266]
MKKLFILLSLVAAIGTVLAGCSSESSGAESSEGSEEKKVVKVGLNGSGVPIWEKIKEKAAKENIEIELVEFSDYVRPNMALADGDIDLNAFQTVSYFDSFIKEHDLDLAPIGTTLIAPMGIYSEKYEDVTNIPEGSTIAIPKEATNMGRALLLLEKAGVIGLPDDFDGNGNLDKIQENPKNLKFEPIVAAQTPRVLPDVAASIINNGVAVEAGFVPVDDAIFIEDDTAQPYINIIAARAYETDKEVYQTIVDLYQEEDVAQHIREVYNDSLIPTFVPLEKIGW